MSWQQKRNQLKNLLRKIRGIVKGGISQLKQRWERVELALQPIQEAIDRQFHRARHRLIDFTIAVTMVGFFTFLLVADFTVATWYIPYWLFDKLKDALLFSALYSFSTGIRKKILKYVLTFIYLRLAWEIAAAIIGQDINSSPIVEILFCLCLLVMGLILLKDRQQWRRYN